MGFHTLIVGGPYTQYGNTFKAIKKNKHYPLISLSNGFDEINGCFGYPDILVVSKSRPHSGLINLLENKALEKTINNLELVIFEDTIGSNLAEAIRIDYLLKERGIQSFRYNKMMMSLPFRSHLKKNSDWNRIFIKCNSQSEFFSFFELMTWIGIPFDDFYFLNRQKKLRSDIDISADLSSEKHWSAGRALFFTADGKIILSVDIDPTHPNETYVFDWNDKELTIKPYQKIKSTAWERESLKEITLHDLSDYDCKAKFYSQIARFLFSLRKKSDNKMRERLGGHIKNSIRAHSMIDKALLQSISR